MKTSLTEEASIQSITERKQKALFEMVNYFKAKIDIVNLVDWAAGITYKISDSNTFKGYMDIDDDLKNEAIFFTSYTIPKLATTLMNCKTEEERDEALQKEITYLFGGADIRVSKKILPLICEVFLTGLVKHGSDREETEGFFNTFSALIVLQSMYFEYGYLKEWEEEKMELEVA